MLVLGSCCCKGSFEESIGAASVEDEAGLDEVCGAGGGAGSDAAAAGANGISSSLGASSGVRMTPPGGIFSLLYLQPGA